MSCSFSRINHQPGSPLWMREKPLTPEHLAEIAAARRNPLSKDQERVKKLEFKKSETYKETHKEDLAYALGYEDASGIHYVYVGVTDAIDRRRKEHFDGIADGNNRKAAYTRCRTLQGQGHTIKFYELGALEDFTEDDIINLLAEQGHALSNAVGGTGKRRKSLTDVAKALTPKLNTAQKSNAKKANSGLILRKAK